MLKFCDRQKDKNNTAFRPVNLWAWKLQYWKQNLTGVFYIPKKSSNIDTTFALISICIIPPKKHKQRNWIIFGKL